jgi:hypothetical protein
MKIIRAEKIKKDNKTEVFVHVVFETPEGEVPFAKWLTAKEITAFNKGEVEDIMSKYIDQAIELHTLPLEAVLEPIELE